MNKEEFKNTAIKCAMNGAFMSLANLFDEFFESNVCIPKGENRHPYADELHGWVEGIAIEWRGNESCHWVTSEFDDNEYRFKPSEPIYEWQYLVYTMFEPNDNKLSKFITDDEFNSMSRSRSEGWTKIEATKRERK